MSEIKSGHHHILPLGLYMTIGSTLIGLTILTVMIAQQDFGVYNLIIAMVIAGIKASLVALYFMHLRYDHKFYATVFVTAITFLAVFIIFILFDTLRRGDIYEMKSGPIESNALIYHPETRPDSIEITTGSLSTESAKIEETGGR
jgi:cytochrome c oxidase subunit 4